MSVQGRPEGHQSNLYIWCQFGRLGKSESEFHPDRFWYVNAFPVDFGYLIIYHFQKVLLAENTHSEIESLWHGAQYWRFSVEGKVSWRSCSFIPKQSLLYLFLILLPLAISENRSCSWIVSHCNTSKQFVFSAFS